MQKAIEQFMIGLGFLANHNYSRNKKLKKKGSIRKFNVSLFNLAIGTVSYTAVMKINHCIEVVVK